MLLMARSHLRRTDMQNLAEYQNGVDEMRRSPYIQFPYHVHLETMAVCNAACEFCPYPSLERQGAKMPDALIKKIVGDLADIPRNVPFALSPFKVNEPFLDVRLFDLLEYFNRRLPHAGLTLTSNASPITERAIERLKRVRNIRYLWISFNDHRPEHYTKVMKLPYQRTFERLQMIHRKAAAGELAFPVVLSRVGDASPADDEFVRWVTRTFPKFHMAVFQRGGWIGQVDTKIGDVPNVGCARWFDLSITATGIVAHCCMDGQAKHPIGDVNNQHALAIYNSPDYRKLREKTKLRAEVAPCNACTFL